MFRFIDAGSWAATLYCLDKRRATAQAVGANWLWAKLRICIVWMNLRHAAAKAVGANWQLADLLKHPFYVQLSVIIQVCQLSIWLEVCLNVLPLIASGLQRCNAEMRRQVEQNWQNWQDNRIGRIGGRGELAPFNSLQHSLPRLSIQTKSVHPGRVWLTEAQGEWVKVFSEVPNVSEKYLMKVKSTRWDTWWRWKYLVR